MWTSADENMPQEYLDGIMEQIEAGQPIKCRFDTYDPANIYDRLHLAEWAHEFAIHHPREGQPDIAIGVYSPGGIKIWCEEAFRREAEIRAHWANTRRTRKTA